MYNDVMTVKELVDEMGMKELDELREYIGSKIDELAMHHELAILAAIKAAKDDGFRVHIGHEDACDDLVFCEDDSRDAVVALY